VAALHSDGPASAPRSTTDAVVDPGLDVVVPGFPGSGSTGPASAGVSSFTPYTGPSTIRTAGTVITGREITAPLVIAAANVTLKGNLIHGPTSASGDTPAILVKGANATIVDNEIRGNSATNGSAAPASGVKIYADGAKFQFNNVYWIAGDGVTVDATNVTVSDNYIHDFTQRDGVHYDAIVYDQNTSSSVLIQHNTVLMWIPGEMSGVLGLPDSAPNIVVNNNLLAGGGFTIEGGGGGITVTNNRFATTYASSCGVYGTHSFMARIGTVHWSGNVLSDGQTTTAVRCDSRYRAVNNSRGWPVGEPYDHL